MTKRLVVVSMALGLLLPSLALAATTCKTDANCNPTKEFCRQDGLCVEPKCTSDGDCGANKACHKRVCVDSCGPNISCGTGETCQPGGFCTPKSCTALTDCQQCSSDGATCQHIDSRCDFVDSICLQTCTGDSDCGAQGRCYGDGTCLRDECDADSDCGRTGFVCRKDDGRCVASVCRYDSDCLLNELCLGQKCQQDPTLYVQGDVGNCRTSGPHASWLLLGALFAAALLRRRVRG